MAHVSNIQAYMKGYEAARLGGSVADNPYWSDGAGGYEVRWRMGFTDYFSGRTPQMKERKSIPYVTILPSEFNKMKFT